LLEGEASSKSDLAVTKAPTSAIALVNQTVARRASASVQFGESFLKNDSNSGARIMPMSRRRKPLVVKKKQNPLSEVQEAAESYAELSQNYNEAAEGYRLRLYEFAARCYWIGLAFARSPASYQQFMSDVFWNDVRQKPKGDEVMKAVLTFAMKAKSKNLRNRVTKTAAVLESFDQLEVKAEHVVVARLKAGGGIEKMYGEISGKYKGGSALPDDLDLLKPAPPEDDDDQPGDADEEQTENSEEESDEGWGDSPLGAKLWDCAAEVNRLAEAARTGTATREELSGSTITITSLGVMGGVATTPIINYPEVAIVGVNKIMMRPVWDGTGFVPKKMMNLSSSFDHRVIDGWDAAVFVQRIKTLLEAPAMIFIEG
jgi:2-oxoacid dehydrogenase/acyltransferase catalytic subunit